MTETPNADTPTTDSAVPAATAAPDAPAAPAAPAAPTVSVVGPGDGETVLLGTTRMRILEDGGTTGHRLGIAESVIAPHTPGPPQHRHAGHDEGFYIVSGSVRFTVGDEEHDAVAGTLVVVPPGAPHTFANVRDEPAVMLSTFTPDPYVRYFRELRDLHAGSEAVTPEAQLRLMRRYATEPAGAPAPGPS
ncbi:cupin domain-containing protein [Kitasatospora purpeofusca]|uniref:cupin domain-containing protein n=1 Tax=Kitasatospora purpeofusca TaxID=67352 RepID=UPI00224F7619|nr:cupin domain-containing protein [Kitasatospora purpeofusca]MCX4755491.1 cupin domain-containing protein [Kitasatospora purpeofusca]WSR36638.1 cupin domain-containing protein [Kitasatospora purpeofusca]